ncbi:MAG: HAMP domain-containing histidine kinase [Reichenbachiella sp.]
MLKSFVNSINLNFHDRELEMRFRKHLINEDSTFIKYFLILVLSFNIMYAFRDLFFYSTREEISVQVQLFVVLPFYVISMVLLQTKRPKPKFHFIHTLSICLFTIFSQLLLLVLNGNDGLSIKSVMIIALFGAYTYSGILYKHALYLTPLVITAICVYIYVLFDYGTVERINIIFIYIMAITGVVSVNYRIEYHQRMNFHKSEVMQEEDGKLKESYLRINALSELRKDLIAVLAHDVRTPIANLQSALHLAKVGDLNEEESQNIFQKIEKQVGMVGFLINDILVWIKSQNEVVDLKLSKTDIAETINELWFLFNDQFTDKEIQLKLNIEEKLVYCQPDMLKSILRNLISNAIKFTPSGASITLESKKESGKVTILVIDEGIGMSEEQVKNWKTSFESGLGTKNEKGIGLGLKICHAMIKTHRTKLTIESTLNKGTKIGFSLDPA